MKKVEAIVAKTAGVESYQTVVGLGIVTNTYQPNYGTIFMRLHPWEERKDPKEKVKGIMASLQKQFTAIPEAIVFPSTSRRCQVLAPLRDSISCSRIAAAP
jgi:HAE1 family hydrophobic/amphiphilic exporter-1